MDPLVVPSPAKINLFLRVVGKRPDGYHDLETLMCPVDLSDRVSLSFDTPHIRVRCDHPQVPQGEVNIAYKAAALFFQALFLKGGVSIAIEKKIPVAAGLGGGSSNAATVLKALNDHYGHPLDAVGLGEVGLQIGADVPFFLLGRPAIARGVGERLEPVAGVPSWWVVLVHPMVEISTAWVYARLNLRLTKCEENYNVSWFLEDLSSFQDFLCNDLEQVTAQAFPEIEAIKGALLRLGAMGSLMSGSGPTVFGLFKTREQGQAAVRELGEKQGWRVETFLVRLLP